MDGMDGMDGWDGWMDARDQRCASWYTSVRAKAEIAIESENQVARYGTVCTVQASTNQRPALDDLHLWRRAAAHVHMQQDPDKRRAEEVE